MGIIKASCDNCGKITDLLFIDYDSFVRCKICHIKNLIFLKEREFNDFKKWLEDTYLKKLNKIGEEISILKKGLKEVENLECD